MKNLLVCSAGSGGPEEAVKPFLKWAGGKGQLLPEIEKYYPFDDGKINKYAEPFVGGGAVLFDILNKYNLTEIYIGDQNSEVIRTYRTVRDEAEPLIGNLAELQADFLPLDAVQRREYYLKMRRRFNSLKARGDASSNPEIAALMIFLNNTCYNGLYRVNNSDEFNVPIGACKNPEIFEEDNLHRVSEKLQNITIVCGDYTESASFIDENTFVYFDPPFRPIFGTSGFTAYTRSPFADREQVELARFADILNQRGAKILISNSDPKNGDPDDDFFDSLYAGYHIERVQANRCINCNARGRGKTNQLLISNF